MTPEDLRSVGRAIANALIPLDDERNKTKASTKFSTPERIIPGITEDVH